MTYDQLTNSLRERARVVLEESAVPPQRYGTAFHLTPPVTDVRELQVPGTRYQTSRHSGIPLKADLLIRADPRRGPDTSDDFATLAEEDQERIANLDLSDVYLAWQLANSDAVSTQLIRVPHGERRQQTIVGSGLVLVVVEEGGSLELVDSLRNESVGVRRLLIWQHAGSQVQFVGLRAQNAFLTEEVRVELLGREARVVIAHLMYGSTKTQSDVGVAVYHQTPGATSSVQARAASEGGAVVVYRGLIDIAKQATGSEGYQEARGLLLAKAAVVDMLPQLEINTNDVRCSHGVTTSHFDEEVLTYLRSRGLDDVAAKQLALWGFYNDGLTVPKQLADELGEIVYDQELP